jgi:hypothetical protein
MRADNSHHIVEAAYRRRQNTLARARLGLERLINKDSKGEWRITMDGILARQQKEREAGLAKRLARREQVRITTSSHRCCFRAEHCAQRYVTAESAFLRHGHNPVRAPELVVAAVAPFRDVLHVDNAMQHQH